MSQRSERARRRHPSALLGISPANDLDPIPPPDDKRGVAQHNECMLFGIAHIPGGAIILLIAVVGGGIWFTNSRSRARHRGNNDGPTLSKGDREPGVGSLGPFAEADQRTPAKTGEPAGAGSGFTSEEGSRLSRGTAVGLPGHPRPGRAVTSDSSSGEGWAVETHQLRKRFGENVAVDNVELLVPRGSAFGYLGPNGAGKTTLMRTLLGLTKADGGTMSLLGVPVPSDRRRALARVGAIVDEPRFHEHLTGRENLLLLAAARGGDAKGRIAACLGRVGLAGRADEKVASYSMGMRQRLGVAACLLGDPELLILDEPMNGMDPAGMNEMRTMIASFVDEGRTVMLSSHLLDEVERTCDAVAIVDHGRVIRQGSIDELVHQASGLVVQFDCLDPPAALHVIEESGIAAGCALSGSALNVTLPVGSSRGDIAEITRRLVEQGISVYGIREVRTSLEDWFLAVTSRFGGQQ